MGSRGATFGTSSKSRRERTEDEAVAKFNAVASGYQALFNGKQRAGPQWELEFYEECGRHPVIERARKLPKSRRASLFVALERILAYDGPRGC